uniref:Reverse transcriptase domain-containing protein n=1 Tax=Chenopodium quinoa TaxID=63459 RepID=A0A803NB48_CHEQI
MKQASMVEDFRPISLCNPLYKIISKFLVNRLKDVLPDVIGDFQNAFVPGRVMMDNCYIAHEILNQVKSRKKRGIFEAILKIDLSKAYDRVCWDLVENILIRMEFPNKWRKWLNICIKSVSYAVLINGEPTEFFKSKAGLRQGYPLSPYLFILVMEVLSRKFVKLKEEGDQRGIRTARRALEINHLFFADDALFCLKLHRMPIEL